MPVQPNIHLYWPAILAAIAAGFVLGFLWFGPIFGKIWAREMKFAPDYRPSTAVMIKATLLQLVGTALTVYVLAHSQEVWKPFSTWGLGTTDGGTWMYGVMSAGFTWLGFFVPQQLTGVAWENKSWKLFAINAGGNLATLMAQGLILAGWRAG